MDEHHLRIEEEFFRILFNEGNAYNKQDIAKMLGASPSYFDKIYRDIKKFFEDNIPESFESHRKDKEAYSRFKYDQYKRAENFLVWFYRQTRQKKYKDEITRFGAILKILSQQPKTRDDILNELEDEKDIKLSRYLNPLIELQIVRKTNEKKPDLFKMDHIILEELTFEELKHLYLLVSFAANTNIISVPGYFFLDTLKSYFTYNGYSENLDVFVFRDNNFARILDEYKIDELKKAILGRNYISFYYFSKTNKKRAFAKTKEPLKKVQTMPIRLLYDHQYGRWYIIGMGKNRNEIRFFKLEGISDIQLEKEVLDESFFHDYVKRIESYLEYSWLLKPNKLNKIVIKFYKKSGEEDSALRNRLMKERRWGEIIKETEDYYLFKIMVNGTSEITPWIRSFGFQAEVIEPLHLRNSFRNEWNKILELYKNV